MITEGPPVAFFSLTYRCEVLSRCSRAGSAAGVHAPALILPARCPVASAPPTLPDLCVVMITSCQCIACHGAASSAHAFGALQWNVHMEGGAVARRGLHFDRAVVARDNSVGDVETEAKPHAGFRLHLDARRAIEALEEMRNRLLW